MSAPTPVRERSPLPDVLRGLALIGIYLANIQWFSGYAVQSAAAQAEFAGAGADPATKFLLALFVDGKFYTLFAILFGAGMAIQQRRASETGRAFAPFFARRMTALLIIGAAHAFFFWFGDILSLYAVSGLVLLGLCRLGTPKLWWVIAGLAAPIAIRALWIGLPSGTPGYGPSELLPAFGEGTAAATFSANLAFLKERWFLALYEGRFFRLLAAFALGFLLEQRCWFTRRQPATRRWRRLLLWGLAIGIPANLALVLELNAVPLRPSSPASVLRAAVESVALPALALAYIGITALALQRWPAWRPWTWLQSAGRLSLTHYIAQSVVGIALFYGVGLGYWGSLGSTAAVGVALCASVFMFVAGHHWLSHARNGPCEALWRRMSYGSYRQAPSSPQQTTATR